MLAALFSRVAAMHIPLMLRVLSIGPLSATAWILLGVTAMSLLAVMEPQKLGWRWRQRRRARR